MPIPDLKPNGDLPVGVHSGKWDEIVDRFGSATLSRRSLTTTLHTILQLARATGKLDRFIVFGSYVTAKAEPNDVDILLMMRDDFQVEGCDDHTATIFNHQAADEQYGASIFWFRPGMLLRLAADEFIAEWQIKRDTSRRGIVEIINDS
jgi:hypothetical protein